MKEHRLTEQRLWDTEQMRRVIRRMAGEIVERNQGVHGLLLVGIRTGGVPLAEAIGEEIERMEGVKLPIGTLDITLYRDDLSTIASQPVVKSTDIPGPLEDRTVVLCDDVLFTGRTVRAALGALVDYGRPLGVQLVVVIDRGHRELPIQADVVGARVETNRKDRVEVFFPATDGREEVTLYRHEESK